MCQLSNQGSIDPSPLVTATGTYLLWKSDDNASGAPTHLWSQQLSADDRSLVGNRALLLSQDRSWQAPVIEGPSMVAVDRYYYLFYGAGDWNSSNAAIGYAMCTSPLGPCNNRSTSGPWLASRDGAVGPSGPTVFSDVSGSTRLAYHAWTGAVGYPSGMRSLWIDALRFQGNRPVLV